jgi:hypothetical protein
MTEFIAARILTARGGLGKIGSSLPELRNSRKSERDSTENQPDTDGARSSVLLNRRLPRPNLNCPS